MAKIPSALVSVGILAWYRLSLSCGPCCCSYRKHLLGSHCVIFFTLPFSGCSSLICTPELYSPTNINYAHTLCPPSVFMKYKFASSLCSEASLYAKKKTCIWERHKVGSFQAWLTLLHPPLLQAEPDTHAKVEDLNLGLSRKCFNHRWDGCCISLCITKCSQAPAPRSERWRKCQYGSSANT